MPKEEFFSYYKVTTSYMRWDDDDVHFVLDTHAWLDVYSASLLKQQSAVRYVVLLGHIMLILSQPVFVLTV